MTLLKFQRGNAKLSKDVFTFSLPAGHTCPGANICLSKANRETGKITDGRNTEFRCFAASAEAVFKGVRASRWENFDLLKRAKTKEAMRDLILASLKVEAAKVRIHVGGDFFSQSYFDAWMEVARRRPDTLFYAYTKSLKFWVKEGVEIPVNMVLTASVGGKLDHLIEDLNLKNARVIFHPDEAEGLTIDHDDSNAQSADKGNFALLIHNTQPAGSKAAAATRRLKKENIEFAYRK